MIASFTLRAKHLLGPIRQNIGGFRPLEIESSGVPKPPDRQKDIFLGRLDHSWVRKVEGSCIVSSNLGYAREQTLKLRLHTSVD